MLVEAMRFGREERAACTSLDVAETFTNCIYKAVFGLDAKKLREKLVLTRADSLRDSFTAEELAQVEVLERLVSSLVDLGWGYEQVKGFISGESIKALAA